MRWKSCFRVKIIQTKTSGKDFSVSEVFVYNTNIRMKRFQKAGTKALDDGFNEL